MFSRGNKSFIRKFMTKQGQTIFKPALASEIFSEDDFVNTVEEPVSDYNRM